MKQNINIPNLFDTNYIKPIDDSKMFYITNDGKIWSNKTNQWLTTHINKIHGYEQISLRYGEKLITYRINRLVALNFVPNPNNYPIVCHKDENKLNNHYLNLEWGTQSYNNNYEQHKIRISLAVKRKIYMCDKITHEKIMLFDSSKDAIKYLQKIGKCNNKNMCSSGISSVLNKKQKSAYGYWWELKKDE